MKCAAVLKKYKQESGTIQVSGLADTYCCSKGVRTGQFTQVTMNNGEVRRGNLCGGKGHTYDDKPAIHLGRTTVVANNKEDAVQDELPFSKDRNTQLAEAAQAKAALEEAVSKSRVIDTISKGEPGIFPPELFIVAGTGTRSIQTLDQTMKLIVKYIVMVELRRLKERYGDRLVIMSGMAEGFDKLLALCAIELDIKLWCAIPNRGYANYYWGRNSLTGQNQEAAFNAILTNAWRVTYVFEDVHGKTTGLYINGRHSNFVRNDYMVEQANAFLVWDPSSSGTRDCFDSIRRSGKPYKVLSQ